MRTTIRMPDHLLRAAKKQAAELEISLTSFIEEAVQEKLYRYHAEQLPGERFELITFKGEGTLPHVDLDNSADLLDRMES